MDFIENNIYHVYNQGNNQQRIFFNYENQKLFLDKIRKHILPYADVLAWCLMSNHFHIMIYVNRIKTEDWEFSSFRDVYGLRNGNLINMDRIELFGLR